MCAIKRSFFVRQMVRLYEKFFSNDWQSKLSRATEGYDKKKKIINIKETHKDLLSTYIMFTCVNRKLGILSSEISFRIM